MKKYSVRTSKVVVEYWEVEAEDEEQARNELWERGEKVDEDVYDYEIEDVEEEA